MVLGVLLIEPFYDLWSWGTAHECLAHGYCKQLDSEFLGVTFVYVVYKANCQTFILFSGALHNAPIVVMPTVAQLHCFLQHKDLSVCCLRCWRLVLVCAVGQSLYGVY